MASLGVTVPTMLQGPGPGAAAASCLSPAPVPGPVEVEDNDDTEEPAEVSEAAGSWERELDESGEWGVAWNG